MERILVQLHAKESHDLDVSRKKIHYIYIISNSKQTNLKLEASHERVLRVLLISDVNENESLIVYTLRERQASKVTKRFRQAIIMRTYGTQNRLKRHIIILSAAHTFFQELNHCS